jgi:glycosyltransferase involved in cell wall biosynthesis
LRFSILMPTYNRRVAVANALRSVAVQREEGQEIEFVVVDDSTDDTLDVARKTVAEFPRCTILTHHAGNPRLRTNGARNRAIEMATGDVFVHLDSDDELMPGALSYISKFLREHEDVDVLFGAVQTMSGRPPRIAREFFDRIVPYEEYVSHEKPGEFLPIVRRRVFMESGVRFQQQLIGFEGILWYTLARLGYRYYFTSHPVRLYNDVGTDRTTNTNFRIEKASQFVKGHVQLIKEFGDDIRRVSELTYQRKIAKAMLYNRLARERDTPSDAFLRGANPVLYRALQILPATVVRRMFHVGVNLYGDS